MNIHEATHFIATQLLPLYSKREAQNIGNLLMEELTQQSRTERLMNKDANLSIEQETYLKKSVLQLVQHQPIQQVIGYAWFAANKFVVNENVLIPRPETEELVAHIIADNMGKQLAILDIGTVSAIDISPKALEVASVNTKNLNAVVAFTQLNFLNNDTWQLLPQYDVIVSNPPYIKDVEKQAMSNNVLLHEPHLALFVPNDKALIFYEKIVAFAITHLKKNGVIWVEINEELGNETLAVFKNQGFDAELIKDMQQKNRMLKAWK
jgi:release factor glutamine methyltransferase